MKIRASIQELKRDIKSGGVPRRIHQQPFDGDPSHYRRLCDLGEASPDAMDLADYAYDMQYMELQPDLLRYLTPVLLAAWRRDLFEGDAAGYAVFVELFWPALLRGEALAKVYSPTECEGIAAYMRNTILDRLDVEAALHFSGTGASPYRWVQALVAYGTLFSDMETLWHEWWQMKTPGHCLAAFQYVSALMYEEARNPVFDRWTREKGGGPPALYECCGMMFDIGWKTENLDFLKAVLTVDYIEQKLRFALSQMQNGTAMKIASGIVDDLPGQRARLELRIEQLPSLLLDVSQGGGFTI